MQEKTKTVAYGDASDISIFEDHERGNQIKLKKGERIFSNVPYAKQMYNLYSGSFSNPSEGEVVSAIYINADGNDILFDAGYKDYIRIPKDRGEIKYVDGVSNGTPMSVMIDRVSNDPFYITGTLSGIHERTMRIELDALEDNGFITAYVKSMNPAGYDMEITKDGYCIQAFMPNTLAGVNKLWNPESIVGESFEVCVESFSDEKGTYIVSRRKYLLSLVPVEIKKLDTETVYSGHVTGTTKFGVFVEFNECLTGMIHITNMNPAFVDSIQSIQPGTPIEFYVKEIIRDKIILTQIFKESLWDNISVGQKIGGTVKEIKSFGALISLNEETVGLIHKSEMDRIGKELSVGSSVNVRITTIDKLNRKIILSLNK